MLDGAKRGGLKACEGRLEDEGDLENAETEGDLKHSTGESILIALTGVIGEAIDLVAGSLMMGVGVSMVLGELTKADTEERDSEFEEIEPCGRVADLETGLHSPTKPLALVLAGLNSNEVKSSIPEAWKVYSLWPKSL